MDVSGPLAPLIFQALRYLGKEGITPTVIRRLRAVLKPGDKADLKRNSRYAAAWMKPVLDAIAQEDQA